MPIPGEELLRCKISKGGSFNDKERMKDPLACLMTYTQGESAGMFPLVQLQDLPCSKFNINGTAQLLHSEDIYSQSDR